MNRQIEICKTCKNQKFDIKTGIICGLTNQKPSFENQCSDFISNKKQKVYIDLSKDNLLELKKELNNVETPVLGKIHINGNKFEIRTDYLIFLISLSIPIFTLVFAYYYVIGFLYIFLPLLFAPWIIYIILTGFRKIIFNFDTSQLIVKNFGITTYKEELKHITGITNFDKSAPRAINNDLKGSFLHYKISIKFMKEIKLGRIKVAGISLFRDRDIKQYVIIRTLIDKILSFSQINNEKQLNENKNKFGTNYDALKTLHKMTEYDLKKLSNEELIELDQKSTKAIEDQNKLIDEVLGLSPEQSKELDDIIKSSKNLKTHNQKKSKNFNNFIVEYEKNAAILKKYNKNIELEEIIFNKKIIVTIENSEDFINYLKTVYNERIKWLKDNKKRIEKAIIDEYLSDTNITETQFLSRISLHDINFSSQKGFEFGLAYDDGGIFHGHTLIVSIDLEKDEIWVTMFG